ncbi:hypothetical protein C8R46DRAFT_240151 [Mycena filopes]|nr:hypothetical protein C8R46DRAFT_240151 [Mycena filopes]
MSMRQVGTRSSPQCPLTCSSHPNIVQICAGASYGNLHATVFHGDLVPFRQYIAGRSPMSTVYLHGLYLSEWRQVSSYFDSMFLRETYSDEFTIWIRSSSGQLCADFTNPSLHDTVYLWESPYDLIPDLHGPTVFDAKNDETLAIHCLSLEQYHAICGHRLAQGRSSFVYTTATSFTPGTVVSWPMPPASEDLRDVGHEIAFLPDVPCECSGWIVFGEGGVENLMENGWMRYEYNEAFNTPILLAVGTSQLAECWLAQANYVFSSLHLESNLENYVLVAAVEFTVIVPDQMVDCPPGYLFFCPGEDFQVGTSSCKWPDNPAYWSLGPSGVERLSVEEATRRGFPPLELTTEVQRRSWDASIYAGLRQFHRAKGFDPKSQDVARHLGLPLFQLSGNVDPPFAHVERYGEEHDDGDRDKAEGSQGNDGEDSKLKATDKNGDRANVETNGQDEREVEGTEGNGLRTDDPPLEDSSSPSDAGQIPLAGGSGSKRTAQLPTLRS